MTGKHRNLKELMADTITWNKLVLFVSGCISSVLFFVYAVPAVFQKSLWLWTFASGEIILLCLRFSLAHDIHHKTSILLSNRNTAAGLISFSIIISGACALSILKNDRFAYSKIMLMILTLLTILRLVYAVYKMIAGRKNDTYPEPETAAIRLAAVGFSIFGWETAFVSHFSDSFMRYSNVFNEVFGTLVYIMILYLGIRLLYIQKKRR